MLNTIRADFYRLRHSKGFWIAQLLLIIFTLASIKFQAVGHVGVIDEQATEAAQTMAWSGTAGLIQMISMISFIMYFILPIIVIILGHDFSKQTYKNSLTVGVSREKYYLSKLVTISFVILLQLSYYYIVSFVASSVLNGVGPDFNLDFVTTMIQTLGLQYLCTLAIITLAILFLYLFGSSVGMVIVAISFPIIIAIVSIVFSKLTFLHYLSFQGNADNAYDIIINNNHMLNYVASPLLFILVISTITIFIFKKREL